MHACMHACMHARTYAHAYDALLRQLAKCAAYLGLGRSAQTNVGDQLGALSVLRDFSVALAKCAAENTPRDTES